MNCGSFFGEVDESSCEPRVVNRSSSPYKLRVGVWVAKKISDNRDVILLPMLQRLSHRLRHIKAIDVDCAGFAAVFD